MSFFAGLTAGLTIAAGFGPAFLFMIQIAMKEGMRPALVVASGIVMGDVLLMLIAFTSVGQFLSHGAGNQIIGLSGGLLLTAMGIMSLLKPDLKRPDDGSAPRNHNWQTLLTKGFIINMSNPFNFIFWVALTGLASATYSTLWQKAGFLGGVVTMEIVSTWLKCRITAGISTGINPLVFITINRITGGIFITAGIYLFITNLMAF